MLPRYSQSRNSESASVPIQSAKTAQEMEIKLSNKSEILEYSPTEVTNLVEAAFVADRRL